MRTSNSNHSGNLPRLKERNQSDIKKIIYLHGPVLRSDIARQLGLTLPTITTNVNTLLKSGMIFEDKANIVSTPGRFALPVDIAADSRYFIGLELTAASRHICICNYRGTTVYTAVDRTRLLDYSDALSSAARMIETALGSNTVPRSSIYGIGLSVPGLIDSGTGMLLAHRQYGWYEKDIVADLRQAITFDGRISIENDASARALGARLFMRKKIQDFSSFLYLYVTIGIASPFSLNDFHLTQSAVGVGELGYMILEASRPFDSFGSTGSLNSLAGMRALVERCERAVAAGKAPYLSKLCGKNRPSVSQIMESSSFDQCIDDYIQEVVFYLGIAVANQDNLLRPESILVDAPYFSIKKYQKLFSETIKNYSFRPRSFDFKILFVESDVNLAAKSAAAVSILQSLNEYTTVPET